MAPAPAGRCGSPPGSGCCRSSRSDIPAPDRPCGRPARRRNRRSAGCRVRCHAARCRNCARTSARRPRHGCAAACRASRGPPRRGWRPGTARSARGRSSPTAVRRGVGPPAPVRCARARRRWRGSPAIPMPPGPGHPGAASPRTGWWGGACRAGRTVSAATRAPFAAHRFAAVAPVRYPSTGGCGRPASSAAAAACAGRSGKPLRARRQPRCHRDSWRQTASIRSRCPDRCLSRVHPHRAAPCNGRA